MKSLRIITVLLFTLAVTIGSIGCESKYGEGPAERAGEAIDDTIEKVDDKLKEVAEDTKDAVKETAEDVKKEVKKAVED